MDNLQKQYEEEIVHGDSSETAPETESPETPETVEPENDIDDTQKRRRQYNTVNRRLQKEVEDLRSMVTELRQGHQVVYGAEQQRQLQNADQNYVNARDYYTAAVKSGDAGQIAAAHENFTAAQYNRMLVHQQNDQRQREKAQPTQQTRQPRVTRAGREWKETNDWYDDPEFGEETGIVNIVDQRLAEEWTQDGYGDDIGSKEYFNELNRRIAKRLPDLVKGTGPERKRNVAGSSRNPTSASPQQLANKKALMEIGLAMGKPMDDPAYLKKLEGFMRKKNG